MKYTLILVISCLTLLGNILYAQKTINVFINKKKVATVQTNEMSPKAITLKEKKYSKIKNLSIEVDGNKIPDAFRHTIQITDVNDSLLFSVSESDKKNNLFNFDLKKIKKITSIFKDQKLYYLEDPKNSMVRIRSGRWLLMTLHFRQ